MSAVEHDGFPRLVPPLAERTEVDVAADVLARLLREHVIPLGMREHATRLLGLQTAEVTEALTRRGWLPPRRVTVRAKEHPVPESTVRAARAPAPQGPRPGRRRKVDADGNLWCGGCEEFHAPEAFPFRADRPGKRTSRCRAARSLDQARRYLSVKKLAALEQARIEFVVDEASELVGMVCAGCGEPICADDRVAVDGAPRHGSCPAEVDGGA